MSKIDAVGPVTPFQISGIQSPEKTGAKPDRPEQRKIDTGAKTAGSAPPPEHSGGKQKVAAKKLHQVMLSYYRRDESVVKSSVNLGENIDIKV